MWPIEWLKDWWNYEKCPKCNIRKAEEVSCIKFGTGMRKRARTVPNYRKGAYKHRDIIWIDVEVDLFEHEYKCNNCHHVWKTRD